MFSLSSVTSIFPYLVYLGLIWGMVMLNGVLQTTFRKQKDTAKTEIRSTKKDISKKNTAYFSTSHDKTKVIAELSDLQKKYIALQFCRNVYYNNTDPPVTGDLARNQNLLRAPPAYA